ncbi:LOW QUALITY PROTEIN: uncharacterized protein VSU04_011183, partial [Chlamydotis macqueenii]
GPGPGPGPGPAVELGACFRSYEDFGERFRAYKRAQRCGYGLRSCVSVRCRSRRQGSAPGRRRCSVPGGTRWLEEGRPRCLPSRVRCSPRFTPPSLRQLCLCSLSRCVLACSSRRRAVAEMPRALRSKTHTEVSSVHQQLCHSWRAGTGAAGNRSWGCFAVFGRGCPNSRFLRLSCLRALLAQALRAGSQPACLTSLCGVLCSLINNSIGTQEESKPNAGSLRNRCFPLNAFSVCRFLQAKFGCVRTRKHSKRRKPALCPAYSVLQYEDTDQLAIGELHSDHAHAGPAFSLTRATAAARAPWRAGAAAGGWERRPRPRTRTRAKENACASAPVRTAEVTKTFLRADGRPASVGTGSARPGQAPRPHRPHQEPPAARGAEPGGRVPYAFLERPRSEAGQRCARPG